MGSMTTRYRYTNDFKCCCAVSGSVGAGTAAKLQTFLFLQNKYDIIHTTAVGHFSLRQQGDTPILRVSTLYFYFVRSGSTLRHVHMYVRTYAYYSLVPAFFSDAGTYRAYFCEGWCDVWLGVVQQTAGWSKNRPGGRGVNMITYHTQFASMHDSISQIRTSFYFIKK